MNKKRRTGIYIVTALVCLLTLAGCGRKYEPVEVPTLEEASGDITLENGDVYKRQRFLLRMRPGMKKTGQRSRGARRGQAPTRPL